MNASHAPRKLRTTFRKTKVISPLHTTGPFAVSSDGQRLITCVDDEVVLTDVESATQICRFKGDTTPITALAITPSNTHLIVVYTSLALRIYELPSPSIPLDPASTPSTPSPVPWVRQIPRAHDGPVHVLAVDPTSSYVASGSADGHVKVWDVHRGYVTHHYGGHNGVVSALAFDFTKSPNIQSSTSSRKASGGTTDAWASMRLITGSVDSRVRIFDLKLQRTEPIAVLEGHISVPRSLSVSSDGKWLVTAGRDSVILVWDLHSAFSSAQSQSSTKKGTRVDVKLVKTVPVLERIEAAGILSAEDGGEEKGLKVFTAGEKGVVKVWDVNSGKVMLTLEGHTVGADSSEAVEEQGQIISAVYLPQTSTIASLHADQTILFHSLKTRSLGRQFIGYNDQIIDATFLGPTQHTSDDDTSSSSHLALATNSSLIRIYDTSTLDTHLLSGHTDMVLCLDKGAGGRVLGSGSKDKSARIWAPSAGGEGDGEDLSWQCVAICEGHTESVGAIAFSRRSDSTSPSLRFMVTGSQDRTIKLWDVQSVPLSSSSSSSSSSTPPVRLKSLSTQVAHEKDINSLDVSPNDQFLATASQDKTAKIFAVEYALKPGKGNAKGDLKLVATLQGHKRGVWNVKFSRFDRVVATASGDKSVKLWSLESFACLKTFEGHTNSVLRVDFLNKGLQLATSAADGLVKIWNVKDEECTTTLDNHEEKVWALAIPTHEKYIVSAAADSVVTFWEDCTELEEEEKLAEKAELVLKEQDFLNYVNLQDYRTAILLALSMDQPRRLFALFQTIRPNRIVTFDDESNNSPSVTGNVSVDEVIRTLPPLELGRLLKHVRNWNANTKTFAVAQTILHAVLKLRPAADILKTFDPSESNEALVEIADEVIAGPKDKDMRALKELLDALIPYTERHLNRAEKLIQDSYVVDYILSEMDSGILVPSENDAMEIS